MARRVSMLAASLALAMTGFGLAAAPNAGAAKPRVIVVTGSIQAAVDSAAPGDTIVVPPGTYEGGVVVDKSPLTIRGSRAAVIDATGHEYGIEVGTGEVSVGPDGNPLCPALSLRDITIDGLTIRHADDTGVHLIGVDGFRLTHGRYVDNEEYGPFPICSVHGSIDHNDVSGTHDAGIYVGDDNGVLVTLLPGLPMPLNDDTTIDANVVDHNNMPNPVPADSGDDVGLLPTGTGILNVGGDHVVITGNSAVGNDSVGVGIVQSPFGPLDPRLEVNPDRNAVRGNRILHNGANPDPVRATTPGADIVYDGTGTGNCFGPNVFGTDFPPGITGLFP